MPSTSSPASISSEDLWETATVVEEGQEDEHLLQKYGHFSSERTDKKTDHRATPSSLRTDHVKRRRIIIGACLGSFIFMILFGFGAGMLVA
ncbi:hypothetical protein D6C84_06309 [Aureobasidium pullulans]|uniref:Uncharacterized protein n=2 Tax=Aureobasidium pullulans TaxID=5580 RepID=A0A074XWK4_AURPU|nr:uncharacterized protein M438DRAFT_343116 [Aureobasidium pullulans EXF-150]OBW69776.1 MAG: Uncharacterized protein AUREO_001650 [Aureobasidium pullulans]KEQ88004.1 hypothetical protein M438DRAFT_343116 [Aureobasidium pullulans EXF-150]THV73171.1 hypothetical protein D6D28_03449 [Aureobasidium pullulans]THV82579.1 hypothetical protein D6D29_04533 [Aureobasidium pullulans]THW30213.1 hypothetical protein D6D23_00386 [Aureobasidium pullulans]